MKLTIPFIWFVLTIGLVAASSFHVKRGMSLHSGFARHRRQPFQLSLERRSNSNRKRCNTKAASPTSPSLSEAPSSTPEVAGALELSNSTTSAVKAGNLMQVTSSQCGASGATESITETTGPNGSEDWLNCGITGSGWNPPNVHINDLVTKDLDEVMKQPNNPFSNCKSFVPLFNKYADQAGVPSIIIASFAMQESSCQPNAVGGAGEQGLMQITRDKCNGMSDSACRDPDYNIRTGAQYFSGVLGDKGGNVLEAIGSYNGWYRGLTKATVLKAPPCQQQNLDYLAQFTNGWLRGRNPGDSPRIGHIRNYDACNGA